MQAALLEANATWQHHVQQQNDSQNAKTHFEMGMSRKQGTGQLVSVLWKVVC